MSRRRPKTDFEVSAANNNLTYWQYFNRLLQLSISMFEWKNVPDTIDVRFLERALFSDGDVIFFKDDVMGFLALQMTGNGPINIYGEPVRRRAYAANGYQNGDLNENNSVIIYNNFIKTPSFTDVLQFSKRLYNLDRIIDVNANAQKTPYFIQCAQDQKLSFLNVYKEIDGNSPVIYGNKNLNPDAIKVLQTGAPYIADRIYALKTQYWNEALTYLGISNVNVQKKERLISDEVQRSLAGVMANRYCRLVPRQIAAEKINNMFGLDIEVEYREADVEGIAGMDEEVDPDE